MDLIKQLEPFKTEIALFKDRGALPMGEVKMALIKVYEDNWNDNKHWGAHKVGTGCGNCIFDMMRALSNSTPFKTVPFKAIKPKVVITEVKIDEFDGKKMHEIRALAKILEIEYTNKTKKDELISLINEKRKSTSN